MECGHTSPNSESGAIAHSSQDELAARCANDSQILNGDGLASLTLTESLDVTIANQPEGAVTSESTRPNGLTSLPNEILLKIFSQLFNQLADVPAGDGIFGASRIIIRDISLVCKQLRELVLASTDVWSHIRINVCRADVFDRHLLRSKDKPLTIGFDYSEDMEQEIRRILAHKDRVRNLCADFSSSDPDSLFGCTQVVFPSVRELVLYDYEGTPAFAHWKFPRVEAVGLSDGFPKPEEFNYESLSRLEIFVVDHTYHTTEFVGRLMRFLQPAIALRTLNINLVHHLLIAMTSPPPVVELPNVEEFHITNIRDYSRGIPEYMSGPNPQGLAIIKGLIVLPNVRKFSVSINFTIDFVLEDWLSQAFILSKGQHSATHLSFRLVSDLGKEHQERITMLPIGELFKYFPNLHSLSLSVEDPRIVYEYDLPEENLKNLRSVHIDNCHEPWDRLDSMFEFMFDKDVPLEEIKIRTHGDPAGSTIKSKYPCADIQAIEPCEDDRNIIVPSVAWGAVSGVGDRDAIQSLCEWRASEEAIEMIRRALEEEQAL